MHASIPASRVVPDDESRLGDTTFIAFQRFAAVRMHLVSEGAARGVSHGPAGPLRRPNYANLMFVRDESLPRHRVSLTSRRDCLCMQPEATAAMKVCAVRARCRPAKGSLSSLQVQPGTLHRLMVGFAASLSP